jgi:predicted O-methyltransferase YrrM
MYDFSNEWFACHVPQFERLLAPLAGQPCRLLEIGSFEGRSATWLLDNIATHPSSRLDIIDVVEHPRLRKNLAASSRPDAATVSIGASAGVLRTLPVDSFDFIYIDGSHTGPDVLDDAVNAFRLLKTGGVMAFDDYLMEATGNERTGIEIAIDAFLIVYAGEIEILHHDYQVWLRKTPPRATAQVPVAVKRSLLAAVCWPARRQSFLWPAWRWLRWQPHPWLRPRTRLLALRRLAVRS